MDNYPYKKKKELLHGASPLKFHIYRAGDSIEWLCMNFPIFRRTSRVPEPLVI